MGLRSWRRAYTWSRVVFTVAYLIKDIQIARGANTDHGIWAAAWLVVFGMFLRCRRRFEQQSDAGSGRRTAQARLLCAPGDPVRSTSTLDESHPSRSRTSCATVRPDLNE